MVSKLYDFYKIKRFHHSFILELKEKPVPECNSKCLISHMESPSELYIQMIDEETAKIDL